MLAAADGPPYRLAPLPGEPPAGYPRALARPGGELLLIAGDKRVYRVAADLSAVERRGTLPVRQGGRGVPFVAADGRLLAVANDNLERPPAGAGLDHAVRLFESLDEGATWMLVSTVVESGAQGCYEPHAVLGADGAILVAYSRECPHPTNPRYQICELRRSSDGGRTWGPPVIIAAHDASRDGMPVLCRTAAGDLVALFETTDAGWFRVARARSDDDGRTWRGRAIVHDPGAQGYSGAPYLVALPGGRLVATFQTRLWSPDEDIALVVSDDGGHSWSAPRRLFAEPGQQLWASLCLQADGRLSAFCMSPDAAGTNGVLARFVDP